MLVRPIFLPLGLKRAMTYLFFEIGHASPLVVSLNQVTLNKNLLLDVYITAPVIDTLAIEKKKSDMRGL